MSPLTHDESLALHQRLIDRENERDNILLQERDYYVVKSNVLIQKSRFTLSLQEQRIILYFISKIRPEDTELKEYSFSIKEFCNICGVDYKAGGKIYSDIKFAIKTLADKSIWVELEDKKETLIRWIEKSIIDKRNRTIKIRLDKDLMPYLLELRERYTSYPLLNIIAMNSKYGIRLYELLKSYANLKSKRFTVMELRMRLGAETKSYDNITNFQNKVLFPALRDIDSYSDLKVTPILIKDKNKIVAIEFIISVIVDINDKIEKWNRIEESIKK